MRHHREIKVVQATTRLMLNRIREAWSDETARLFLGLVGADKSCIGGRRKDMPKAKRETLTGRDAVGESTVAGVKDRATMKSSTTFQRSSYIGMSRISEVGATSACRTRPTKCPSSL